LGNKKFGVGWLSQKLLKFWAEGQFVRGGHAKNPKTSSSNIRQMKSKSEGAKTVRGKRENCWPGGSITKSSIYLNRYALKKTRTKSPRQRKTDRKRWTLPKHRSLAKKGLQEKKGREQRHRAGQTGGHRDSTHGPKKSNTTRGNQYPDSQKWKPKRRGKGQKRKRKKYPGKYPDV